MKKIAGFTGMICILCVMFSVAYYASYKRALKNINQQNQVQEESLNGRIDFLSEENKELLQKLSAKDTELPSEDLLEQNEKTDYSSVVRQPNKTLLPSATYIEEVYQVATEQMNSEIKVTPGFLVGMSREELVSYLSDYMQNLSLAEYEAGLLSYELISFSENRIILRKTYNENEVPYKYFVNIQRGMVTVFYSDLKTVYEYTHINAVDLSENLRNNLIKGVYVKNREELYSLLESCSS